MSFFLKVFLFVFSSSILLEESESFLNVHFLRSHLMPIKFHNKGNEFGKQYFVKDGKVYSRNRTSILQKPTPKDKPQIATSEEIQQICNFKEIVKVDTQYFILTDAGDTWFPSIADYNIFCKNMENIVYYISNNYNIESELNTDCEEQSTINKDTTASTAQSSPENISDTTKANNNEIAQDKGLNSATSEPTSENSITTAADDNKQTTPLTTEEYFDTETTEKSDQDLEKSQQERLEAAKKIYHEIIDSWITEDINDNILGGNTNTTEKTTTKNKPGVSKSKESKSAGRFSKITQTPTPATIPTTEKTKPATHPTANIAKELTTTKAPAKKSTKSSGNTPKTNGKNKTTQTPKDPKDKLQEAEKIIGKIVDYW